MPTRSARTAVLQNLLQDLGLVADRDLAAGGEQARSLYEYFVNHLRLRGVAVETGVFQAAMSVHLVNDGPVTLICESRGKRHGDFDMEPVKPVNAP